MFIYVCCAGGMSSSLFCMRMVKALKEIYPSLHAMSAPISTAMQKKRTYTEKYDLILTYGGIDLINPSNVFDISELLDVIFVAPQVAYLLPLKQEILKDAPIILKLIDKKIFGTMDGAKACGDLLDELVALDLEHSYLSAKLVETKNSDKNVELLFNGLDRKGAFAAQVVQSFEKLGLRVIQEKYTIENLYDFQPQDTYDIRLLFAYSHMLDKADMRKISRRIDGLIYVEKPLPDAKMDWFQDYHIPMYASII